MTWVPAPAALRDAPCLVVGGGWDALRATERLLHAGARVTVVSPTLIAELASLRAIGDIRHIRRNFRSTDISDICGVVCASQDLAVVRPVTECARQWRVALFVPHDRARSTWVPPRLPTTLSVAAPRPRPQRMRNVARLAARQLRRTAHAWLDRLADQIEPEERESAAA